MRAFLMVLTFAVLVCTGGITSATPLTYQFSGVRFTFLDGVAVPEGTFAFDSSTGEFSSVDFFLSSPDPFASGDYDLACCGGPLGLSFVAEPINTHLTLQFLDRLSDSPDRIVSAVLDLTLVGQPTYTATRITGNLVPVDEPSTFWLVLVALCVTVGIQLGAAGFGRLEFFDLNSSKKA
jgi:hypothetical protein